jgi:hypothetical protein
MEFYLFRRKIMAMGRPTIDLSGQRFEMLVVIKRDHSIVRKDAVWLCKCDCGKETYASSHDLRYGRKKSCGCSRNALTSKAKLKDVTGMRVGRLVAIKRIGFNKYNQSVWECKCDCGNYTNVSIGQITSGGTLSCGCLHKETFNRITHNESKTRLYRIWCGMRERCYYNKSNVYKWYGAKGISICDEWHKFENFRDWAMANGYKDDLTIDRIDSNKNYEPSNCRWITRSENARIAAKEMQRRRKNVQKFN